MWRAEQTGVRGRTVTLKLLKTLNPVARSQVAEESSVFRLRHEARRALTVPAVNQSVSRSVGPRRGQQSKSRTPTGREHTGSGGAAGDQTQRPSVPPASSCSPPLHHTLSYGQFIPQRTHSEPPHRDWTQRSAAVVTAQTSAPPCHPPKKIYILWNLVKTTVARL